MNIKISSIFDKVRINSINWKEYHLRLRVKFSHTYKDLLIINNTQEYAIKLKII